MTEPTPTPAPAFNIQSYKTDLHPVWCPGCGDFGVLTCIYRAFAAMQIQPQNAAIVSGIGCSSRLPAYVNVYGLHSVHGRVLPMATGLKTARPEIEVLGVGGDGDAYSIGGGHIPHVARRNPDICYIVMDNEVYGLTKGQSSATAEDFSGGTTPYGNAEEALNPIAMAVAYNISFIARGYSGKPKELAELIQKGVEHKGFALIEVLSPCTTFNDNYKPISQRVKNLPADYDPTNRQKAFATALDKENTYLGIFYRREASTFSDRMAETQKIALETREGDLEKLADTFV